MLHEKFTIILWNFILACNGAIIPVHNRQGKLSLIEWTNYNYHEPEGYGTYAFGYDVEDPDTNNVQFRNEEKLSNGSVVGSYGYLESSGNAFVVRYIADQEGYRAVVDNSTKLKYLKPIFLGPFAEKLSDTTDIEEGVSLTKTNKVKYEKPLKTARIHIADFEEYASLFHSTENNLISKSLNKNENKKQQVNPSTNRYPDPNFSSEEESNSFYYPQNILESPDFHKKEDKDKIIFQ